MVEVARDSVITLGNSSGLKIIASIYSQYSPSDDVEGEKVDEI